MKRALALCVLIPASVAADEVWLKGGGRLSGVIVAQTERSVVLDAGPGRITLPRARVEKVVVSEAALDTYRDRAARLRPQDAAGWVELGYWAERNDLQTQARQAFEHALLADPNSAAAHRALGHELVAGQWLEREQSLRARGLVDFEGRWIRPEERQAILEGRAAEALASQQRAEAEARIREAEARARVAEAEARRAETDLRQQEVVEPGVPYPWGAGPGFYGPYGPALPSEPQIVVVADPVRTHGPSRGPRGGGPHRHDRHCRHDDVKAPAAAPVKDTAHSGLR